MRPSVAVLDYGIGNLRSAQKALLKEGADAELTDDPEFVLKADGVVLPGVGHFGTCMGALRDRGLDGVVAEVVESGTPFLGICVGMQMLYEASAEAPGVEGLSILEGEIKLLSDTVRRPQIQWNQIHTKGDHPLVRGLDGAWMYFVHSNIAPLDEFCIAGAFYGEEFPAAVAKGSVWATQFHPEKSGQPGLSLVANFVEEL